MNLCGISKKGPFTYYILKAVLLIENNNKTEYVRQNSIVNTPFFLFL
jgi:hypothetical protein